MGEGEADPDSGEAAGAERECGSRTGLVGRRISGLDSGSEDQKHVLQRLQGEVAPLLGQSLNVLWAAVSPSVI